MNVNILHWKRAARAVLLVLLLGTVGTTNALALDFTEGNLTYTVNEGGISVTVTGHANGTSATGALDIPQSVTHGAYTYAVTDIQASAFYNCSGLTSVTIPNTVTTIGNYAFSGCSGLLTATIGTAVTSIGRQVFDGCSGLLTLNYNATNCSGSGFNSDYYHWLNGCSSLVSLNIGENVQTLPDYFVGNTYGYSFVGTLTIPNSVTSIGSYAFYNCYGFASATIGNSVTSIGNCAFLACTGLASVSIPISVTYIGSSAFASCTNLASVAIPESVVSVESGTFSDCINLASVSLPNSLTAIGDNAFNNCDNLASITIPNTVVSIGYDAFYSCNNLTSVTLGSSLTSIGSSAFRYCNNLTTIDIPNSVVSIGNYAFANCGNLTSVTFGTSLYSIGDYAFSDCSSLTSIEIPASVASVGTGAFNSCAGLAQITVASGNPVLDSRDNCNAIIQTASNKLIVGCKNTVVPNTVNIIGEGAFYGCTGLASVTLPDALTSIEASAFSGCTGLTSITIGNTVTTIGNYAFSGCSGLLTATIGTAVTSIGRQVFDGCSGLLTLNYNATNCSGSGFNYDYYHWLNGCSSLVSLNIGENVQTLPDYFVGNTYGYSFVGTLTIPNSVTSIGHHAFYNCYGFASATIGNSVTSIGDGAFLACTGLASVNLPSSVTYIGSSAFESCTNLASVAIPESVVSIESGTFSYCTNLASVSLPNSLTAIGDNAFNNCDNLASITIPNTVVSIGYNAFYSCNNLTSVILGSALTSIGSEAFRYCGNLGSVTVHAETPPYVGSNAFNNVPASIPVYVPCEYLSAYTSVNWGGFSNIMGACAGEITVTANPAGGGTVSGAGSYEGGATCTLSATSYGYLPFLNWTKNGEVVSANPNYSFIVTGDADFVANFGQIGSGDEFQIGSGTATNDFLPSYNYYKYSLTQQIYTAAEMGGMAGTITSIAFYNGGSEKTRSYDIYLTHTTKDSFYNTTDWISVSASEKVFSGNVTMSVGDWTTIFFDTPFAYDGVSNLALIVDDNTGSYSNSPHMSCLVFNTDGNQALYKYNDNTNYDPYNPSGSGTLLSVKNQIKLEIASATGDNIIFADEAVKTLCVANWDTDGDGELSYVEAASVTDLGDVFKNNNNITSFDELEYFTGLTEINGFTWCHNLTSVTLPITITSIGFSAFFDCWNLASITIPNLVTSIGYEAFSWCSGLSQIIVNPDNTVFDSREDCNAIIETATNKLVFGCMNTVIPNTVTMIKGDSFRGCSGLTSITIPSSIDSIIGNPFTACYNLEEIIVVDANPVFDSRNNCNAIIKTSSNVLVSGCKNTIIPEEIVAIGEGAFKWCRYLTSIVIPENVTSIGTSAFFDAWLSSLTVYANTPPTLAFEAFGGAGSKTIPVRVPCSSVEAYASASWGGFTNFVGMCPVAITATASPTAGGTVTGAGTFNAGETCTLTATANEGYSFINWTLGGEDVSTEPTYSFTVTEASAFVANFELNRYAITATANPAAGGVTTGAGTYDHGATATLTATANVGYTFINWTKDGEEVSNSSTYSFTVTEVSAFVANFEMNSYVITAEASPTEGGTVAGGGTYDHGTTATVTATANTGYHFANWTKDGTVVSTNATYSFTALENASFVAHFELNSYVVTATANPTVGGTVTGGGTYYHMEAVTLTATPNMGYRFVNWTKDGMAISASQTLGFMVTEDADYVANFETCSYNITALAIPSVGGMVMGSGAYDFGETVMLTATPNANYGFVNWTENGVEVSTEATYSFTVTGSRSLVANFSHDHHWTVNPFAYESTMTIIGIVQVNGEEQYSNQLEVGAFSGDECRGREWLTDQYYVDFGHYFVFLTVYGNDNDQIDFRLYDHAIGQELDLTCSPLVFQTNGLFGNPGTPYVFDFSISQITQTTDLTTGWNWWSTYVESDDLFNQLKTGLGGNAQQIKSSTTFVNYFNGMWIGGLSSINNESCYLINNYNACTLEMTGNPAAPANHPITINPNWNWIGYPNTGALSVANAFSNFTPSNGDQVKSQNAFSTYYSGMWIGGLNTITPGMGLLYKSNSTGAITFVYPEPNRSEEVVENVTNVNNHWTADYHAYPSNMTVMAVVELDDVELQSGNYEIAAFANDECRGSAKLVFVEPLDRYVAFLTVVGDEASELRFSLYDSETGTVETQNFASLQYETNAIVGSLETPYVIRFRSTTGMDEWATNVNIFPNPVAKGEQFSLGLPAVETRRATSLQIVNALGVVVETLRATSVPAHITAPNVAGVYTLRITVEGKGTCFRKLVVR